MIGVSIEDREGGATDGLVDAKECCQGCSVLIAFQVVKDEVKDFRREREAWLLACGMITKTSGGVVFKDERILS